ncbi:MULTISPECIES: hypothetical protein [unclassified Burkholderia]|uniref:hypothetical protein n=1 Tax=unclassified Burkholderia TaxID=2613784 RepID=UPI001E4F02E1|nr:MULTISPECIES: hypothetical protein [unclassified Burkholderia]UEP31585.1 hypothetical protein LMA01_20470 [Burkholderia sp. B21-007]UEP43171.1 hypothetical protein LMA02_24165 [Burkholderia sp. B21-005]
MVGMLERPAPAVVVAQLRVAWVGCDMSTLSNTMSGVEYRDARLQAQAARDELNFDAGYETGMAEAEHEIAGFAKRFIADPNETMEARCRRFMAEFIGSCDCCYDELSKALAQAVGMFQEEV